MAKDIETHPFGKIARFYDAVYADKDYKSEVRSLCRLIRPEWDIFDIGCGTGRYAELLIQTNHNTVMGLEPSEDMAKIARSRGIYVVPGRIQDIHPEDVADYKDPFNCVLATFDVLDYIIREREYTAALRNINRLLDVGGFFFYEGWNKATMPDVYSPHRKKKFVFEGETWERQSYTVYLRGQFSVQYVYRCGDTEFREEHVMKPRLCPLMKLDKFGFVPVSVDHDDYSVKTWFVKIRNV